MAWAFFDWDSLGARLASREFARLRKAALDAIEPEMRRSAQETVQQATQAGDRLRDIASGFAPPLQRGPLRPGETFLSEEERIGRGAEVARQFGAAVQTSEQQAGMRGLGAALENVGLTPRELGSMDPRVRSMALTGQGPTLFPEMQPFWAEQRLQEQQREAARPLLAGGPGPKALLTTPLRLLEEERQLVQPKTRPFIEPLARLGAEALVPSVVPAPLRALGVPDVPGRQAVVEPAAAIAETIGAEVALPSNLIPIPIVDDVLRVLARGVPVALRLLKAESRMATRAQLDELAAGARRFLTRTTDPSERQLIGEAVEALAAERPIAGAAPAPAPGAAQLPPQEPVGLPEPQVPGREQGRFPGMERLPEEMEPVLGVELGLEPTFRDAPAFADAPSVGGRDFVGEELTRKSLPTVKDVQRWSQRLPPEERAAMAAEVAAVRRPVEDFDVVVAREGNRFRRNLFTKLDDLIQPLLGRDRSLQTAVRNIFVSRDVYIGRQAGRMRLAAREWVGRQRETLGLVTGELDPLTGAVLGQRKRGYALAVQVRAGAKMPPKAKQHLNHIIEHPEKYVITPEQQAALDEYEAITTSMLRAEQRHGVDVEELIEGYAPRIITKAPRGQDLGVATTQFRQRFPSTHPWYTKGRAIPDVEQLFAAGFEIADPIAALEIRLATGVESIANQRSVRALQGLGKLPSEQVPDVLRVRLRAATDAHSAARKQALQTGSVEDRALAEQTSVALDQAKRDMRKASQLLRERQPKVLGRNVPPDVASETAKFLETEPQSAIDDIFRVMRTSLIQADYGSVMLQNASTFWRNNPAWLKALVLGARSIADAPYDYIVRNADVIDVALRYGMVSQPEEFLLRRGGGVAEMVNALPVVRPSQNIFEWNVFVAQVERAKGVIRLAKNEEDLLELGAVLRKQSGSNFMPGLTRKQAAIMAKLWFAPQFTTALQGALVDPIIRTGVGRREAIKGVGALFGGAATMTVALHASLNDGELPNMTDPDKPGFWGIRVGAGFFYPFGPYQPFVVAMARTARVGTDLAQGKEPSARDVQAWPNFIVNKTSLPVRFASRLAEAMGIPLENIRGGSFAAPEIVRRGESPLAAARRELGELAPIGPAQAIEGIRKGARITALEVVGGRTTIETASQQMRRRFEEKARQGAYGPEKQQSPEYNPDVDWIRVEQDPELVALRDQARKDAIGRGFESSMEAAERRRFLAQQEQDLGLPDIARQALAGNEEAAAQFARVFQDYEGDRAVASARDFFDADERKLETDIGKAYGEWVKISRTDYWDAETREYDYTSYWADKDVAFQDIRDLDPDLADAIEARVVAQDESVRQMEARFKPARLLYRELRDIPKYTPFPVSLQEKLEDFRRDMLRAREERKNVVGSENVESAADFMRIIGGVRGLSDNFIEAAINLGRSSWRAENISIEYENFIIANRDPLLLFYPDLRTDRIGDLILAVENAGRGREAAPVLGPPSPEPVGVR
jgi:hypothetical protein